MRVRPSGRLWSGLTRKYQTRLEMPVRDNYFSSFTIAVKSFITFCPGITKLQLIILYFQRLILLVSNMSKNKLINILANTLAYCHLRNFNEHIWCIYCILYVSVSKINPWFFWLTLIRTLAYLIFQLTMTNTLTYSHSKILNEHIWSIYCILCEHIKNKFMKFLADCDKHSSLF